MPSKQGMIENDSPFYAHVYGNYFKQEKATI